MVEAVRDIYQHTELKTDTSRNLLSSLYSRNPTSFKETNEEVSKLLENDVIWPKGYVPNKPEIKKVFIKKSDDEVFRQKLKEKH